MNIGKVGLIFSGVSKATKNAIIQAEEFEVAKTMLACVVAPSELKKIGATEMRAIGMRLLYEHIVKGGTIKEVQERLHG